MYCPRLKHRVSSSYPVLGLDTSVYQISPLFYWVKTCLPIHLCLERSQGMIYGMDWYKP